MESRLQLNKFRSPELKLRDNSANRYIIVDDQDRHVQLKCVWFCNKEDLGDEIFCLRVDQLIWVAKYHSDHMKRIDVSYETYEP